MKNSKRNTVLITDASRGSSLAIIRSLGKRQMRVIAADSTGFSLGFTSRYVQDHIVYPSPDTSPGEFAQVVLESARSLGVDLIIPVTDSAILPLSRMREQFEGICHIAMPDAGQLDVVTDKLKTIALAHEVNVPVPVTHLVHTVDEAIQVAPEFKYPIVLKPQRSKYLSEQENIQTFNVTYASHQEDLIGRMRVFEGRCAVLLQEYYSGQGHGVELLTYEGQPLAVFQHKRLHEVPLTGGASSLRESVPVDRELYNYSAQLLKALHWSGLAMIEFKVGPRGPRLMEINGRVWGSLPLATHSGMDFPAHLADLYLKESVVLPFEPSTDYRIGVRSRNLEGEIRWILAVLVKKRDSPLLKIPGRWEAIKAALSMLNPTYKSDILSWKDPVPGIMLMPKIALKFLRKQGFISKPLAE